MDHDIPVTYWTFHNVLMVSPNLLMVSLQCVKCTLYSVMRPFPVLGQVTELKKIFPIKRTKVTPIDILLFPLITSEISPLTHRCMYQFVWETKKNILSTKEIKM